MASEIGVLPIPEDNIVRKWRLQPGKMLLIDLEEGRIIEDEEIKAKLAEAEPYEEWLTQTQFKLEGPRTASSPSRRSCRSRRPRLLDRQQAFGYTQEDINRFLEPMARDRRRSDRLDGHRHADRGALQAAQGCSTTTSSRTSPRSPTRRSTRSARSW